MRCRRILFFEIWGGYHCTVSEYTSEVSSHHRATQFSPSFYSLHAGYRCFLWLVGLNLRMAVSATVTASALHRKPSVSASILLQHQHRSRQFVRNCSHEETAFVYFTEQDILIEAQPKESLIQVKATGDHRSTQRTNIKKRFAAHDDFPLRTVHR